MIKEDGEKIVLLVNGELRSLEDTTKLLDYLRLLVPQELAALQPFESKEAKDDKAFDLLKTWLAANFSLSCEKLTWTAMRNTYTYEDGRPEIGSREFYFLGTDGYEHTEEGRKAVGCWNRPPKMLPNPPAGA